MPDSTLRKMLKAICSSVLLLNVKCMRRKSFHDAFHFHFHLRTFFAAQFEKLVLNLVTRNWLKEKYKETSTNTSTVYDH